MHTPNILYARRVKTHKPTLHADTHTQAPHMMSTHTQAWAGHPGTLVRNLPPVDPPSPSSQNIHCGGQYICISILLTYLHSGFFNSPCHKIHTLNSFWFPIFALTGSDDFFPQAGGTTLTTAHCAQTAAVLKKKLEKV